VCVCMRGWIFAVAQPTTVLGAWLSSRPAGGVRFVSGLIEQASRVGQNHIYTVCVYVYVCVWCVCGVCVCVCVCV